MTQPLISVITVVYNNVQHIEQCIKSVLGQTYLNIEYIVVDGASTDGTVSVIEKYSHQITHFISEPDEGIYNAMNKGLKIAQGDIIALLNADDYYYPETIQHVVDQFIKEDISIVYGNLTKYRIIESKEYFIDIIPDFDNMQRRMGVFHPSTFIKRGVYKDIGGFNEKYKLSSDYDLILKAYNKGYVFKYLNKSLVVFRIGGASNTDCNSYKETIQVLKENKSPYVFQMRVAFIRCHVKKIIKQSITVAVKLFGLQKILNKRLHNKWAKA